MRSSEREKISAAVDRYIAHWENPSIPRDEERVLMDVAWPVRYYIEAREKQEGYKHWHLSQLHKSAMYDGSEDSEYKSVVALSGLRYLRSVYSDLKLDPSVNDDLDRLELIFPDNPFQQLFDDALNIFRS